MYSILFPKRQLKAIGIFSPAEDADAFVFTMEFRSRRRTLIGVDGIINLPLDKNIHRPPALSISFAGI